MAQDKDDLFEMGLIALTWNPYPPGMKPQGRIFLRALDLRLCEISAVAMSAERKGVLVIVEGGKEYQVEESWEYVMGIWKRWLSDTPEPIISEGELLSELLAKGTPERKRTTDELSRDKISELLLDAFESMCHAINCAADPHVDCRDEIHGHLENAKERLLCLIESTKKAETKENN